jgi:hypothetical protein
MRPWFTLKRESNSGPCIMTGGKLNICPFSSRTYAHVMGFFDHYTTDTITLKGATTLDNTMMYLYI